MSDGRPKEVRSDSVTDGWRIKGKWEKRVAYSAVELSKIRAAICVIESFILNRILPLEFYLEKFSRTDIVKIYI